jgi:hypothetical protein
LAAIVMNWKQNQACCYCLMTNRILRKIKNQNTEFFKADDNDDDDNDDDDDCDDKTPAHLQASN